MTAQITANLKWPAEGTVKLIDTNHKPEGNTHLLSVKDFSFHSNPTSDYGGNDALLNPEDLLLSALSSCFFMTFFAIANKARIGLLAYECNSELFLAGDKVKFAEKIVLNLNLKLEAPQEKEKILDICQKAHKYCIIANSIKSELEFNINFV